MVLISNRRLLYDMLFAMFEYYDLIAEDEHDNFNSAYVFKPFQITITSRSVTLGFEGSDATGTIQFWEDLNTDSKIKNCMNSIKNHLADFYIGKDTNKFKKFYNAQFQ